ncbi:hypothetical protein OOT00_03620 [Desulfobotulus sp. H1]|uniref:Uncharacterized protein n=2 Tax=Desulfobotulus TaxID=48001 RepID=A0A5Q4VDD3_9BACT|nr:MULTISPECIES: hypothetical protein [Desulfobotulus]MCW7753072.1 hypothetical protein [Desulfobotulus pelophilus]TYT75714.1 hypothetical protein FIM25_02070 [Desulfobotulus mexicanus]
MKKTEDAGRAEKIEGPKAGSPNLDAIARVLVENQSAAIHEVNDSMEPGQVNGGEGEVKE